MAIERVTRGGDGLERRVGLTAAKRAAKKSAKKGAKHAIEKHAAKKHAMEKHAGKKAAKKVAKKAAEKVAARKVEERSGKHDSDGGSSHELSKAFHHLQRAGALISLLEQDSGGDLRHLLEHGIELYRAAVRVNGPVGGKDVVRCAVALLRASEHLAMAGLYAARVEYRVQVEPPDPSEVKRHLAKLLPRMEALEEPQREQAQRLMAMARELLRRAQSAEGNDPHLEYEYAMAADGLCAALEEGI